MALQVAVISPLGFALVLLMDAYGPGAFSDPGVPFNVVLFAGAFVSAAVYVDTRSTSFSSPPGQQPKLPRCYPLLTLVAFASSVVWMDLLAG